MKSGRNGIANNQRGILVKDGKIKRAAAIRQGDWKLHLVAGMGGKIKKDKATESGLYNLTTDPGETTDVSAKNPGVVAKLRDEAARRDAEFE